MSFLHWKSAGHPKTVNAQNIADAAAATSISTTGWVWLVHLDNALQIVATLVAIAAGIYAIAWHRARLKELQRHLNRHKMYEGTEYEVKKKHLEEE